MTTLVPRAPYSSEELAQLYPKELELQQVQVILRHGERTPVSARFENAGLPAYWPYCTAASMLKHNVLTADAWDTFTWKRRLETFERQLDKSGSDSPASIKGPSGEIDYICNAGELTDRGRETTLALGQRLRNLYVDRLNFLPARLDSTLSDSIRLRATPIPRALQSTQQVFTGLYPQAHRDPGLSPPAITQRSFADETLFPNEGFCKRFNELAKAFAARTAQLWNDSPELEYVNKRIGKYMPAESPVIKVDSHPRLSGVMDTINATLAHGPATRLPSDFYDPTALANIDRVCTEEWFVGYLESNEYRKLGIGALVGDLVQNMVEKTQSRDHKFKLGLSGCHDTTIAALLASLGAYDTRKDKWPPYTSSIAFELHKRRGVSPSGAIWPSQNKTWWSSLFGSKAASNPRTAIDEMSASEKQSLEGYYVRVRYNDKALILPYCQVPGRHLEGDEGLCTLAAFKEAADSVTPKDWKAECKMNLGQPAQRPVIERPPGW
ncbi:hypothetical protein AMS68_001699 [Peltaster fructicola]|uniref:3-phytase n=1 Tax=Peltaster fructicola TaxID=286661 RepID=A0A6H0XN50_9PEZI|nr:hypothetical protein AMS68_001699 [Peltaster fructicola]